MLRIIIVIISIFCTLFLLYGLIFAVLENEPNRCRMTYMFEYPQFVRIHFPANKYYPKYGLYAYSEGALTERTRSMDFTGAPVIFIPGNAGSYKQARSLASVAIRKGIDNGWYQHLDFFSIDFNEEYSGLFGGYLESETEFVKSSINAVLNLYQKLSNKPEQVILIGHSMGGKVAQALLTHDDISPMINSVITIATPIDQPVLKMDEHFSEFYQQVNKYFETNRSYQKINNQTNFCAGILATNVVKNESLSLDDKLIISLGGGSRDYMVHSGLTSSKFSDINSLTTSISNVWATTDHLCSVWCLQLVLVLNRFLHSIITPYSGNRKYEKFGQQFTQDKSFRLAKAKHFLVKPDFGQRIKEIDLDLPPATMNLCEWEEDSRRVFSKFYEYGLNKTIIQMIRLTDSPHHKYLSVVAANVEYNENFLMGCAAIDFNDNMRYCRKATSLSKYITKVPTIGDNKVLIKLDLHKIKETYSHWTHIIIRFNPTRKRFSYSIDVFDPTYRFIKIHAPKWNSYSTINLIDDTLYGSSFYKFEISGIEDSYQFLAFNIKPKTCSRTQHHSVAKVCIPWMENCNKYQHFTNEENRPLYIEVPKSKPLGYNTTENPITIQLHLDANCRYRISYQNSFGGTMYKVLYYYFHWLPAHMVGILLMAFRHQITITPKKLPFKCGNLYTGLLVCSSFFIITMSRIFGKLCQMLPLLPQLDPYSDSMMVSILIHGAAFAIVMLVTVILWLTIKIYGNMAHKILLRIIRLPISLPSITDTVMPIIEKIPISSVVILVFIASTSCGGVAIIVGWLIYFMQILKQYEDYLEEFVYDTAKMIAEKLFGKVKSKFFKKEDKTESNIEEKLGDETQVTDIDDHSPEILKAITDNPENDNKKVLDNENENIFHNENESKESERKTDTGTEKNLRKRKKSNKNSNQEGDENETEMEISDNVKSDSEKDNNQIKDDIDKKQLAEKSEILLNTYEASLDQEFPEDLSDAELNKLLDEAIAKQKQILNQKKKKESLERLEYDSVHESFSSINFHLTLLILLGILLFINLPATLAWAKNYTYNQQLTPDPSYIPALIVLISISLLKQFNAPRNVHGYTILSGILYAIAGGCILYCQDSIYRLNYIISAVFIIILIQQLFLPKKTEENNDEEEDKDLKDKIERMKNILAESGDLEKAD